MLNVVIVLMVATSTIGPVLTERFAPSMLAEAALQRARPSRTARASPRAQRGRPPGPGFVEWLLRLFELAQPQPADMSVWRRFSRGRAAAEIGFLPFVLRCLRAWLGQVGVEAAAARRPEFVFVLEVRIFRQLAEHR